MWYNSRISQPHSIIGLKHLERLPAMIADRQRIAAIYDEGFRGFRNLSRVQVPAGGACNYYKYIGVLKETRDRRELKTLLKDRYGVAVAGEVHDEQMQTQPVFEK